MEKQKSKNTERGYNMKKVLQLFVMMFLVLGSLSFVLADENETEFEENETELPEPGRIGWFENSWDKMRLSWKFNKEAKLRAALEIAEERLAEADAIAETDPEKAEILRQRYEYFVERAQKALEDLENSDSADVEGLNNSMRKMARAHARMEEHHARAILAHDQILERMRANNASEDKLDQIGGLFERFENRSKMLNEDAEHRRERMETKFKVLAQKNDSEMMRLREHINDEEGYEKAYRMRELKEFARNATPEEVQTMFEEQLQERFENHPNLTEEEKGEMRERLEESLNKATRHQPKTPRF